MRNLATILEARQITAYRLAKLTGLNSTYVLFLKKNRVRKPSADVIRRVAQALKVQPETLFLEDISFLALQALSTFSSKRNPPHD
jgi:transcriptional regulator with XRE-family HTH domain